MKYFIDAAARAACGQENFIEFKGTHPTAEFRDAQSLYMAGKTMRDMGFGEFWWQCVTKHGFFDMDTLDAADWPLMAEDATRAGGAVAEVAGELAPWLEAQFAAGASSVGVVWAHDRALAHRRRQREAHPLEAEFLGAVAAIDDQLPFARRQAQYEQLLIEYKMPQCFFPYPLNDAVSGE